MATQNDQSAANTILAPPLSLYAALTFLAVTLVLLSFTLWRPDWPGLLLGLATNISAAVLLVVLIDRRLRASDIEAIKRFVELSPSRLAAVFIWDARAALSYAAVLNRRLQAGLPEPMVDLGGIVKALATHKSRSLILLGDFGVGKTTSVQSLAATQAWEVALNPRRGKIPVLIPLRRNEHEDLKRALWLETRPYARVSERWFQRWLTTGRITAIFDGLDECSDPKRVAGAIRALGNESNLNRIIVTSRPRCEALSDFGDDWAMVEIPRITREDTVRFLLRRLPPEERIAHILLELRQWFDALDIKLTTLLTIVDGPNRYRGGKHEPSDS